METSSICNIYVMANKRLNKPLTKTNPNPCHQSKEERGQLLEAKLWHRELHSRLPPSGGDASIGPVCRSIV